MELKPVALYREMYQGEREDLPSIQNAAARIVEPDRERILDYMRKARQGFDVMESVPNLFRSGEYIPGGPSLSTDGIWVWRTDSLVYLTARPLVLPALFVEDVRDRDYVPADVEWTDELGAAIRRWW
ncbi:hypothetical protein BTM25_08560 [Actinomadura rubteroloni]|uniref:Uncharacterized protein n=1 Tax=Actinomadura rubteroloni TaxID=1926885 RepID=A0A2P4UN43_9ACTN|nr:hypothetical protein [Actinomadura rubteroloni]POM26455.1 hypothetical protein BTM25_08560 [Actinomadura rubteroloni]